FTFQAISASEIEVTRAGIVVYPSTYTVALNPDGTGSVTPTTSWGSDEVYITSTPSFQQGTNFGRFGAWYPDQINPPLDRLARGSIALREEVNDLSAQVDAVGDIGQAVIDANASVVAAAAYAATVAAALPGQLPIYTVDTLPAVVNGKMIFVSNALQPDGLTAGVTAIGIGGVWRSTRDNSVPSLFNPAILFLGGVKGVRFDPQDVSSLWQDSAGTIPAALGQPVGKMSDLSGNGYHATQATAGLRPILRQDTSGKNYLEFDGATSSRFLATAAIDFSGTDKIGSYAHVYHEGAASAQCIYSLASVGTSGTLDVTSNLQNFIWSVQGASRVSTASDDAFQYFVGTHAIESCNYDLAGATIGAAIKPRISGLSVARTLAANAGPGGGNFSNLRVLNIGRRSDGQYAHGRFHGLLIAGANTTTHNRSVVRYLGDHGRVVPFALLGDSTATHYSGATAVAALVPRGAAYNMAYQGDTIALQKAKWVAVEDKTAIPIVVVQIGLNDMVPANSSAAIIAAFQDLITTIRIDAPQAFIYASQLTPAKFRLNQLGVDSYQKWLDLNNAIAGLGSTPIINVNGRITSHVAILNDGVGNLKAEYQSGLNDGIHSNTAAHQVNADAIYGAFVADGFI
ncbi:GDSL-type esterase/lipase family protein, partial [Phenylobacterium sp.]|uniref:GDSL-type esterase/lipase family protein n=1 Tax=Phenylobacterium sp. TaxID=1871053 RepID=UPI00286C6E64